jgi:hypothetical protein
MRSFNSHLSESGNAIDSAIKSAAKLTSLFSDDVKNSQQTSELEKNKRSNFYNQKDLIDKNILQDNLNSTEKDFLPSTFTFKEKSDFSFQDDFKPPVALLNAINNYKYFISFRGGQQIRNSKASKEGDKLFLGSIPYSIKGSLSLFNTTNLVSIQNISPGVPLIDTKNDKHVFYMGGLDKNNTTVRPTSVSISDCSIKNLVYLSSLKDSPLGKAKYRYADFMYCKDLGKVSNNHLITLRRFPGPVEDNIMFGTNNGGNALQPDMGRMVTWFGTEDNKLENIINFDFHSTWKEFTGEWQKDTDTNVDSDEGGMMAKLANSLSPSYANYAEAGFAGNRNIIAGLFGSKWGKGGPSSYRKMLGQYDQHKIYTPKNIINKTNKYEGQMDFSNSFTLTFRYKMRAYDNINQKSAFLDLIGNILATTYSRATFWGGGVWWQGPRQNNGAWNTYGNLMNGAFDKIGGVFGQIFNGNGGSILENVQSFLGGISGFNGMLSTLTNAAGNFANSVINSGTNLLTKNNNELSPGEKKFKSFMSNLGTSATKTAKGTLMNKLGRPQMYALNSILQGSPTGPWHVTIGNPLNPIVSMGNMIIDKVQLQQTGPLGIDDFPSEIICKVTLKHGMPRDIISMSRMYTCGGSTIYSPIGKAGIAKFLSTQNSAIVKNAFQVSQIVSSDGWIDDKKDPYAEDTVFHEVHDDKNTDTTNTTSSSTTTSDASTTDKEKAQKEKQAKLQAAKAEAESARQSSEIQKQIESTPGQNLEVGVIGTIEGTSKSVNRGPEEIAGSDKECFYSSNELDSKIITDKDPDVEVDFAANDTSNTDDALSSNIPGGMSDNDVALIFGDVDGIKIMSVASENA